MKRILISVGLVMFCSLLISSAFCANLTKLERISINETNSSFDVSITFSKPYQEEFKKPLLGGNYLQYEFKDTYIEKPKQTVKGQGSIIENVVAYQYDRKNVRLRIFIDKHKLNKNMFDKISSKNYGEKELLISYDAKAMPSTIIVNKNPIKEEDIASNKIENETETDLIAAIDEKARQAKGVLNTNIRKEEKAIASDENAEIIYSKNKGAEDKNKKAGTGSTLFKMSYSLGIVLLIVMVLAFAFKKFTSGGTRISLGNKMVKVLNREYIGPKSYLAVVKVIDRYLLLGVTNENISTLTELTDVPEEIVAKSKETKTLKLKKQESNLFGKLIKNISDKMESVKEAKAALEKKSSNENKNISFGSLEKMGREILEKRAKGMEKISDPSSSEDPFITNLAAQIKDRVKKMPQI